MNSVSPNILFIMFDQMTAKALSCYGRTIVKTPHISRLARQGVVFENAYCNSPLCAPSRFSMMSGMMASDIGAYDNASLFPEDVPTMAHYLRDMGYRTCLAGKMHFIGADQCHGFEERLTTDIYPADFGWVPDWKNADYRPSWYHDMLSVVLAGPCITSNQIDFDETVAFSSCRRLLSYAKDPNRQPFFLVSSFTHPHDPFTISKEYWDLYEDDIIDMPRVPPISYEDLDPHSRRLFHVSAMHDYVQTQKRVRRARRAYYGEISYVDQKVGQLLQVLEVTDLLKDTIIVITSDHGEMLGERGLWYKMSHFEGASRVPLIIHAPGRFSPRRVKQPVSLVDIMPTLVDLGGKDASRAFPGKVAGKSLVPLLKGKKENEQGTVYSEILCEGAIAPVVMIRKGVYKYIHCDRDPEQLYDLEKDPDERINCAILPEYKSRLREFRDETAARWDLALLHENIMESQARRRVIAASMKKGRPVSWDFQPFTDASRQYIRGHLDLNTIEGQARYPRPAVPVPDGRHAPDPDLSGVIACVLPQSDIKPDDLDGNVNPPKAV